MELELAVRRQITAAQVSKWPKATRSEKGAILDAVCLATGWHRDHARKAIRVAVARGGRPPAPRGPRPAVVVYGEAVIDALRICWATLDGPTGKRLAPALLDLVPALRRHHELDIDDAIAAALLTMSPATIDRRLAADRAQLTTRRGRSLTKPGSMLKSSIPFRTWAEWADTIPGFCQIDTVGHEGGDPNGEFCHTLTVTDVATGWTENRSIMGKGERRTQAALADIRLALPFDLQGVHVDNGSEFINHHLTRWCDTQQITMTRSRPARKNDNPHAEQKNWTVVRHATGYWRYDTGKELDVLNRIWALQTVLTNLFTPQQKLLTKTRTGAKVTKTYDTARTPARRLLDEHPDLVTESDRATIEHQLATANPAQIRRDIGRLQDQLKMYAVRRGPVTPATRRHAAYTSRTKINPPPPPTRASSDESTKPVHAGILT
jgi:transposase InsO family protein